MTVDFYSFLKNYYSVYTVILAPVTMYRLSFGLWNRSELWFALALQYGKLVLDEPVVGARLPGLCLE